MTNSKVIVYNSLSTDIALFEAEENCTDVMQFSKCYPEFRNWLIEHNFLVDDDTDEALLCDVKKLKEKSDSILEVTILITLNCNFNCRYCYEEKSSISLKKELQNGFLDYIQKNIMKYTAVKINWFGGEPLLMRDSICMMSKRILEIVCKNKRGYVASITTNGYYLDVKTFKSLLANRVLLFQVTLDGPQDIHDKFIVDRSGNGTFNIIFNNLLSIKEEVKSSFFKITIRTNVSKSLLYKFDEYLEFLNKNFGDDQRFTFVFRAIKKTATGSLNNIDDEIINENIIYDYLLKSNVKLNYEVYKSLLENFTCNAAKINSFTLMPDGKITKCTDSFYHKENIVGELLDNGYINLYEDKLHKWLILKPQNEHKCVECAFRASCNNCVGKDIVNLCERPCATQSGGLNKILELFARDSNRYESFINILK